MSQQLTKNTICGGGYLGLSSLTLPGLCVLPSGRMLCGFRAGSTKGDTTKQRAALTISDDGGQTWSSVREPFTAMSRAGRPGTLRSMLLTSLGGDNVCAVTMWVDCSDPSRPFFDAQTEVLLDSRMYLSFSRDGGDTWDALQPIDTSPYDQPVPMTGPVLAWSDGLLACQFELNKGEHQQGPWVHLPVMIFSRDGGRTWGDAVVPARDPENRMHYWDQRPTVLRDGSLINSYWMYDQKEARYHNVRVNRSWDRGKTWTKPVDAGFQGQPTPVVELPDGRLVMVYMDRSLGVTMRARVSSDHGATWPAASEVTLAEAAHQHAEVSYAKATDAWQAMEKRFAMGLPSPVLTAEGSIAVAYYAGDDADHTDIVMCRFRP